MMNFLRYCCINSSLISCIFWIFWPAEAKTITQVAGSRVTLNCPDSDINITMGTWKFNEKDLISFKSMNIEHNNMFDEGVRLKVEMSDLESERYALIIKEAQKLHEGNYSCKITATSGVFDEFWELKITESNNNRHHHRHQTSTAIIIAAVASVCFLVLISALVILTQRKKNKSPSEIRQQKQVEDIYENRLEIQRHQAYLNKP